MSSGSVARQEREFLACVIRHLPELFPNERQAWIENQDLLSERLELALDMVSPRIKLLERLNEGVTRVTKKGHAAKIRLFLFNLGSEDQVTVDKLARAIVQAVDPASLKE